MRAKDIDDYSGAHLEKLKAMLAGLYSGFGGISDSFYLVGGLVPDLLVKSKLSYLKEYIGTLDIDIGVYLAFEDFITRDLKIKGHKTVSIKIPNIIPFLTLKIFAYMSEDGRAAKDAFDIWYAIVNFKDGPDSVKKELSRHKGNKDVCDAFDALRGLFGNESSPGVKDVSDILTGRYMLDRAFAYNEVIFPMKRLG